VSLSKGIEPAIEAACAMAQRAASAVKPVVFCPPIATFQGEDRAREEDVVEAFVLTVDCDKNPKVAIAKVEAILGPPTITVNSGGEWVDQTTGEVQPKLHGHWVLKEAVKGATALTNLKVARRLATELVGGDPSGVPAVHPFRWPGSWHRKGEPRLCAIVSTSDNEIDLDDALAKLQAAVGHNPFEQFADDVSLSDAAADPVEKWRKLITDVLTAENNTTH